MKKTMCSSTGPQFGDRLIIGKFCSIACGATFLMGSANHRVTSISAYPFSVFGGAWEENTPPHLSQLPFKGDTVVGNDVWFGRDCRIIPGVTIGHGAIVAAYSVVTKDVEPYTVVGGCPARPIKKRFDDSLIAMLLELAWWDFSPQQLVDFLPVPCSEDIPAVKDRVQALLKEKHLAKNPWPRG